MVPPRVKSLLAIVECEDLYEFLKLDRTATPAQLRTAARKEFDRLQNRGLRHGIWEARKDLAGLCQSIFKDEETKREYDRTLNAGRFSAIRGLLRLSAITLTALVGGETVLGQAAPRESPHSGAAHGAPSPVVSTLGHRLGMM